MKNPKIALVLKQYRKKRNLTVQQVADTLAAHGYHVAPKTIYGWENGATQPDSDTLMFLCELYDIKDILFSFGYRETPKNLFTLNSLEKELIQNYRSHPNMQEAVLKLLDVVPQKVNYLEQNKKDQKKLSTAAEESNWNPKEK